MNTIKQYIADGTTAIFNIPFPYLDQNHVGVSLNGFPMNLGAHFEYVNGQSIRFRPHVTPVANVLVELKRETPIHELLVQFQNGATLTQDDLNTACLQSLYSIEELWDRYETRFGEAAVRLSNGEFTDAQNLIDAAVASVLDSTLLADLQARYSDIDANAESILQQTLRLDGIDARIVTVETTVVTEVEQVAQTLTLMGAANLDNTAFILDMATVRTDATTSLAQKFTSIESNIDGNSASITEQATVLDGLTAQWMLKTNVNGHVAGFGLYNDGATSQFIVSADIFAVSNGANVKTPFVISGGVCFMQNVVIQDALIENLTVGKLTSGILTASITQNADINVGTGRVIWNNGTYMKVSGVGFGTANQFLDWFGPTMAISSCSEANATQYLKTNGDAYFGGTLSAGTLTTKGQTSDTTITAQIVIGPFGSNGNPINVAYSLACQRVVSNDTPPPGGSLPTPSATIILERSVNGGAYVQVASHVIGGSSFDTHIDEVPGSPPNDWRHTQLVTGSFTYADNLGTTDTRTYRLRRDGSGTDFSGATQTLSVIATEE